MSSKVKTKLQSTHNRLANSKNTSTSKTLKILWPSNKISVDHDCNQKQTKQNIVDSSKFSDKNSLRNWGFPEQILSYYLKKGVSRFFQWQVECLELPGVLDQQRNLVYSAPTSAGKTMVSDILLFKTLLERRKKAIIILPFVSITIEKVQSLKYLCRKMGFRIDSFAGQTNPPGGLQRVDVAVCTIEKANNMVNRLIEENKLSDIGLIVVDELHMIGDSSRGYILELILSKIVYMKRFKFDLNSDIQNLQIVGMSATIPNLDELAKWLDAQLYITNFRPVPLNEYIVVEKQVMSVLQQTSTTQSLSSSNNAFFTPLRKIDLDQLQLEAESLHSLIYLVIETVVEGYSTLVFCPTKTLCESLARFISKNIFNIGKLGNEPKNEHEKFVKERLTVKEILDPQKILSLISVLKRSPAGCDHNLEAAIRFGCAFHHAGLTMEERGAIEQGFRDGTLKVLCCTTTLSAGVNLPARRVMITSPYDYSNHLLEVTNYRQMIGRAGRKGIDTLGESFLFCQPKDMNIVRNLLSSSLKPIKSYLILFEYSEASPSNTQEQQTSSKPLKPLINDSFLRAVLEVISNGLVHSYQDIVAYLNCTFFNNCPLNLMESLICQSDQKDIIIKKCIEQVLEALVKNYFICFHTNNLLESTNLDLVNQTEQTNTLTSKIVVTSLGRAVIASGVSPSDGSFIFKELERCRENLCLLNDLHLVYETTPTYVAAQLPNIDWRHYFQLYDKMDSSMKKVAKLVGVKEYFIFSQINGSGHNWTDDRDESMIIHRRFYASLALYDLIQEISIIKVQNKYGLNKGLLQSLQQQASTFASMLTIFCNRLGWSTLELLIQQFQPRLSFGVQHDLIDLVRLPCISSTIARQLYSKGYDSVISLIYCKPNDIETALISAGNPLLSGQSRNIDPNQLPFTKIYISTMDKYITIRELSTMIVEEARMLVEKDVGQKLHFDEIDPILPLLMESSDALSFVENETNESEKQEKIKQKVLFQNQESPNQWTSFTKKTKRIKTKLPPGQQQPTPLVTSTLLTGQDEGSSYLKTNRSSTPEKLNIPNMSSDDDILLDDISLITNDQKQQKHSNSAESIIGDEYELENMLLDSKNIEEITNSNRIIVNDDMTQIKCYDSESLSMSTMSIDEDEHLLFSSRLSIIGQNNNFSDKTHPELIRSSNIDARIKETSLLELSLNGSNIPEFESESSSLLELKPSEVQDHSDSSPTENDDVENFLNLLSTRGALNQLNQLPLMYETQVSVENFRIVRVFTEDQCKDFMEKVFNTQDSSKVTTVALYFRLIQAPSLKHSIVIKRHSKCLSSEPTVDVSNDQYLMLKNSNLNISELYVTGFNQRDLYCISGQKALFFLRNNWFQYLAIRTLSFKQYPSGSLFHSQISESVKQWRFVCYNVKQSLQCLFEAFEFEKLFLAYHIDWFDFNVALWLLDPESTPFDIEVNNILDITKLAIKYQLNSAYFHKVNDIRELTHVSPKPSTDLPLTIQDRESTLKTLILFNLIYDFLVKLRERNLYQSYRLIEIPSRICLFLLETNPIEIDYEFLNRLEDSLVEHMKTIETKIFSNAGLRFNLASPNQVARVLYSQCNLISNYFKVSTVHSKSTSENSSKKHAKSKVNAKLPGHLGTSKMALIKLQEVCGHKTQLPLMILEWHRLNHALSNSIRVLRQNLRLESDERALIYCHCSEWTQTGRIIMHNPNLINLAKDFEITTATTVESSADAYASPLDQKVSSSNEKDCSGKSPIVINIRKMIVSPKNFKLVTADYCQLELRILAHFSKDPNLISILNESKNDVFKSIASDWKQIPYDQVDYQTRQQAKQVCYGMIYGMGDESLAEKLAISKEEAIEYKKSFFKRYPKLDQFKERAIQECKNRGYVETISGRRRSLAAIHSSNYGEYSRACRQAINTKIQGSASDIIKIAMVAVHQQIERKRYKARFLLQIHDELMYQVHQDDIFQFMSCLKRQMESVSQYLQVLLPVKVFHGLNWSQMEQYVF